ncbi:hypothetical protein Unana1_04602 [Umbelopsis nana]
MVSAKSIAATSLASTVAYVTYVRATASPALAHSHLMTARPVAEHIEQWKLYNKGFGINDVGRSCGGL